MSGLDALTSAACLVEAAHAVEETEDQATLLRQSAVSVYSMLAEVWPQSAGEPSFPNDVDAAILANEYYLKSLPVNAYSASFNVNVLFMAESAAATPPVALGKSYAVGGITDNYARDELSRLLAEHHLGHVNLVHCPTYGALPFIDFEGEGPLTKGEQKSIDGGTPQFWKVLLTISGYYDKFADGEAVDDPLRNKDLYKDSAEIVTGTAAGKSTDARAQCIKNRIKVMEAMQRRGHVLADVCPVPMYTGIGNTVKLYNKSTGKPYTSQSVKFKPSSKKAILQVAWKEYGSKLVKYYKPRRLVILGKSMHDAIGKEAHLLVESFGGEYLGYVNHPSWNGHYGNNIMPLLRDIRAKTSMKNNAADTTTAPKDKDSGKSKKYNSVMDMNVDTDDEDGDGEDDEDEDGNDEDEDDNDKADEADNDDDDKSESPNNDPYDFSSLNMSLFRDTEENDSEQQWLYDHAATAMAIETETKDMSFSYDFGNGDDVSPTECGTAIMEWVATNHNEQDK